MQTDRERNWRLTPLIQHLLHHQLAAAVGAEGLARVHLVNGRVGRLTKDGRRRREDEPLDACLHHALQQIQRVDHVVAVVPGRVPHRFDHLNERGKVHHRIELPLRQHLPQQGQISQVTLNETAVQDSITVPAAEVVQRGDLRPLISRQRSHLGAYITSTPDQQTHTQMPPHQGGHRLLSDPAYLTPFIHTDSASDAWSWRVVPPDSSRRPALPAR